MQVPADEEQAAQQGVAQQAVQRPVEDALQEASPGWEVAAQQAQAHEQPVPEEALEAVLRVLYGLRVFYGQAL